MRISGSRTASVIYLPKGPLPVAGLLKICTEHFVVEYNVLAADGQHSASVLRRELDAVEKRFPLRKPMVVIGHSMGGCMSRLLITDTGDKLWMKLFKKPPEQVPLSPEAREIFTEALIFRHRPEIGRVIFISAPLRGSDLASNWVGRIGSSLVRAPSTLLSAGDSAIKITTFHSGDLKLKRIPNSVDTLAPNNPFVKAINTIPITPGIP